MDHDHMLDRTPSLLIAFSSLTYEDIALNELGGLFGTRPRTRLAPGAWLLTSLLPAPDILARARAAPPIFTRQLVLDVVQLTYEPHPDTVALAALALPAARDAAAIWLFD